MNYDTATGAGWGINAAKGITGGRKGYKAALFEGGVGVPFIARWPGRIAAGRVDDQSLISAVDLLPTFCEIAEVKLPAGYTPDGVSQLATLQGDAAPEREKPLFWKSSAPWPAQKGKPNHWVSYAVVHQTWKLVTNKDGSHFELYALAADPYEKNDLSSERAAIVKQLQEKLEAWKATLPEKPTGDVFSAERSALK